MHILAVIGSPRKGGNTDLMTDALLTAAGANGHTSEKVYLYDRRIIPCTDCRACKRGTLECVMNDGMKELYPEIDRADVIVLGTPVYWLGPTGPMKVFMDRLRPYFGNKRFAGKRVILVAPAGAGPSDCDLLAAMVKRSCAILGATYMGEVLATAYDMGDVLEETAAMTKAATLGKSL